MLHRLTLIGFFAIICSASTFAQNKDCNDEKLYASAVQTRSDSRFDEFQKIYDQPSYKDGEKKLNKFIQKRLRLSDDAKNQIFNLNFSFTITCDGKMENIKIIGGDKTNELTNIADILEQTKGKWTPAIKDGSTVNCIYVGKIFINGKNY